MKVASVDDPIPRGRYGGPPLTEVNRFKRCRLCGGSIDILDLAWIEDHEGPLPHTRRVIGRSGRHHLAKIRRWPN